MAHLVSRKARNLQRKAVAIPATNTRPHALSPVPPRFNSTSEPLRVSIVRTELSSVTEPNYLGNVFSNRRSILIP